MLLQHISIVPAIRKCLEKIPFVDAFIVCIFFPPKEIKDWIKDKNGPTALCPHCGIDAVIGESSGYPITEDFLKEMNEYWF